MTEYDKFLRMAGWMKDSDEAIKAAILQCQALQHGVVALKFSNEGQNMDIEILDEEYDENVRVYPG